MALIDVAKKLFDSYWENVTALHPGSAAVHIIEDDGRFVVVFDHQLGGRAALVTMDADENERLGYKAKITCADECPDMLRLAVDMRKSMYYVWVDKDAHNEVVYRLEDGTEILCTVVHSTPERPEGNWKNLQYVGLGEFVRSYREIRDPYRSQMVGATEFRRAFGNLDLKYEIIEPE